MIIKYKNISYEDYSNLSEKEKEKPYCIKYLNGDKDWYVNRKLHREDGPAIINRSGEKRWYINDKLHKKDGTAIVYPNESIFWYINGKEYLFEEWCEKLIKTDEEIIFLKFKYY